MKVLIILMMLFSNHLYAKKKNVRYEYKKYERFDFEALDVEGTKDSPGDLSIGSRFGTQFKNKLPEKKNFNREMRKAVDSVL